MTIGVAVDKKLWSLARCFIPSLKIALKPKAAVLFSTLDPEVHACFETNNFARPLAKPKPRVKFNLLPVAVDRDIIVNLLDKALQSPSSIKVTDIHKLRLSEVKGTLS